MRTVVIQVIDTICCIIIISTIIIDKIANREIEKPSNTSNNNIYLWIKILEKLTNIAMILFLIQSATVTTIVFGIYPASWCVYTPMIATLLYHICRCVLYAILVIRLHISFNGSFYEYSLKYIISPLLFSIFLWFIVAMICDYLYVSGIYDYKIKYCNAYHPQWGLILSGSIDFVLSSVSLGLFVIPMFKLRKLYSEHKTKDQSSRLSNKFTEIVVKYFFLVMICIFSTFVCHIIIMTWQWTSDFLATIDNTINLWCIILLKPGNKKVYRKTCWLCTRLVGNCWQIEIEEERQLEIAIETAQSSQADFTQTTNMDSKS
eukprot:218879_1